MTTTRRSRDETRTLMLEAGAEILLRDGINLGASTFRYADAFELLQTEHDIKVTRGSVHERIWASQEAWQFDVLAEILTDNEDGRRTAVNAAIAERLSALPVDTDADRMTLLAESCRVGSLTFLQAIADNPSFRLLPIVIAAWKASANNLPEFDNLGRMLGDFQNSAYGDVERGLTGLIERAGLDVDPSHGLSLEDAIRAYCVSSTALAYSHTLRSTHDPKLLELIKARCPDGEVRDWNHLGLGVWLIARGLFRVRTVATRGAAA